MKYFLIYEAPDDVTLDEWVTAILADLGHVALWIFKVLVYAHLILFATNGFLLL